MQATMTEDAIDYCALARELELTRQQRAEILRDGLVTPVGGRRQGRPTRVTRDDEKNLRAARRVLENIRDQARKDGPAIVTGITIIVILRLIISGAIPTSP